jgi:hypothetical protein
MDILKPFMTKPFAERYVQCPRLFTIQRGEPLLCSFRATTCDQSEFTPCLRIHSQVLVPSLNRSEPIPSSQAPDYSSPAFWPKRERSDIPIDVHLVQGLTALRIEGARYPPKRHAPHRSHGIRLIFRYLHDLIREYHAGASLLPIRLATRDDHMNLPAYSPHAVLVM